MGTITKEVIVTGFSFEYETSVLVARYCDKYVDDGVVSDEVNLVQGFEDGDLAGVLALCGGDVNAPLYLAAVFLGLSDG